MSISNIIKIAIASMMISGCLPSEHVRAYEKDLPTTVTRTCDEYYEYKHRLPPSYCR